MKIQSLLFLGVASLALATAQSENGYGFVEQRDAQDAEPSAPTFELLRTSYIAPSTPAASTSASQPLILTPSTASAPAPTPAASTTKCADACTAIFKPVCGSDGKTYSNSCMLAMTQCKKPEAKITLQAEGECAVATDAPAPPTTPVPPTTPLATEPATVTPPTATCSQMCLDDFTPVCGSDGKTYSNACRLSVAKCENPSANIAKASDGECASVGSTPAPATPATTPEPPAPTPAPTPAPETSAPAPATPATATCADACSSDYKPVCGSDGKTYSNPCALSIAQCKSPSASIAKVSDGACALAGSTTPAPETPVATPATPAATPETPVSTPAKCTQLCTSDYTPVCGSDGQTYSNACALSIAQCLSPSVSITKMSEGACASGTATSAPAPVASTTESPATPTAGGTPAPVSVPAATKPGQTSPAKCELACTKKYAPVCGSNGKTYNNACLLRLANCKSGSQATIIIKSEGACSKKKKVKPSGSTGAIAPAPAPTSGGAAPSTSTGSTVTPSGPSSSTDTSASTSTSTTTTTTTGGGKPNYLRGSGAGTSNSPYQGQ